MSGGMDDDEYVANLLVQDAKDSTKKYELVGIDAFNPRRAKSGAPKPNTSFLRHIIRQTDSHNAALLAKEAEESNARLREMNRKKLRTQRNERLHASRKAEGRLTPVLSEGERPHPTGRRRHDDDTEDGERNKRRKKQKERSQESQSRRHRSRSRDSRREPSRRERSKDRASRHSTHHRRRHSSEDEESRSRKYDDSHRRHRKHRSRSRDSARSRSRDRNRKARHRSRSPRRDAGRYTSERTPLERYRSSNDHKRRSPSPAGPDDSDPLEALVGPLPPSIQPALRSRGRGAHKSNITDMDSRFSSTYDPSLDVRPASDAEDDWGDALEAFRDRQRFKQQGAERLRAAGFTDAQVKRLEKGGERDGRGEEDVMWSKGGQREWDRGKVVDDDGDVELKAEWGRLK